MARAIFLPRNLLFSTRASIKPSTVERTTTATVHTRVFFKTRLKEGLLMTFTKFSMPLKPLIFPARLTSLMAIWNTDRMGIRIKTAIKITLGAIQIYGSTFRNSSFPELPEVFFFIGSFFFAGTACVAAFTGTPP